MMIKLIWAARDAELSAALLAESFVQVPSVVQVPLKLVLIAFFFWEHLIRDIHRRQPFARQLFLVGVWRKQVEKIEETGIIISIGAADEKKGDGDDADGGLGFVPADHFGLKSSYSVGESVNAIVLDVNDDGVCEMSLKPDLVSSEDTGSAMKKKKKRKKQGTTEKRVGSVSGESEAVVQLVKQGYLVVTVAKTGAEADSSLVSVFHVPMSWYNTACCDNDLESQYRIGDKITVICSIDSEGLGGCGWRIASFFGGDTKERDDAKRARVEGAAEKARGTRGKSMRAVVVEEIEPHRLIVAIGNSGDDPTKEIRYGSIHITDTADPPFDTVRDADPMRTFKVGQVIENRAVAVTGPRDGNKWVQRSYRFGKPMIDLSLRSSMLDGGGAQSKSARVDGYHEELDTVRVGDVLRGFVLPAGKASIPAKGGSASPPSSVFVSVSRLVKGRMHMFDAVDDYESALKFATQVGASMETGGEVSGVRYGDVVEARVTKVDAKKNLLDLERVRPGKSGKKRKSAAENAIEEGELVLGIITKVLDSSLMVMINRRQTVKSNAGGGADAARFAIGRVPLSEVSDAFIARPTRCFAVGNIVLCKVMKAATREGSDGPTQQYQSIDLSLRASRGAKIPAEVADKLHQLYSKGCSVAGRNKKSGKSVSTTVDATDLSLVLTGGKLYRSKNPVGAARVPVEVGDMCAAYVKSEPTAKGCFVNLCHGVDAFIRLSELSEVYVDDLKGAFPSGKLVIGRVLSLPDTSLGSGLMAISLKNQNSTQKTKSVDDFEEGMSVYGIVKRLVSYGAFITIDESDVVALCHISDLDDEFVDDGGKKVKVGCRYRMKIVGIDDSTKKVNVGIKKSLFEGEEEVEEEEEEEEEGSADHSEGESGEESEGSELDSGDEEDAAVEDDRNDPMDIANDDGKVSVADLMTKIEPLDDCDDTNEDKVSSFLNKVIPTVEEKDVGSDGSESESEGSDDSDDEEDDQNGSIEEDDDRSRRQKRKAKKKERAERERQIASIEQRNLAAGGLVNSIQNCSSVDDYKRLVFLEPDESKNWIAYADFVSRVDGDHEQAKRVIDEALTTINYRCVDEKLAVWTKLLNLEYEKEVDVIKSIEACMRAFERGRSFNDEKGWHFALLSLFKSRLESMESSGAGLEADGADENSKGADLLFNECERIFKVMEKKFRESSDVWLAHISLLLDRHAARNAKKSESDADIDMKYINAARGVLDRSLLALPSRSHLQVIVSSSVQFYSQVGGSRVGSAMFEKILANSPKKVDIWSVYIDQEVKLCRTVIERRNASAKPSKSKKSRAENERLCKDDLDRVRLLFDRATALDLKAKKMKLLFKKYLDFETRMSEGDERVAYVKKRAMEFVEKKMGDTAT